MSTGRATKSQDPLARRSPEALKRILGEKIQEFRNCQVQYDAGETFYANRMAGIIYVLLESGGNTALLWRFFTRKTTKFLSKARGNTPTPLVNIHFPKTAAPSYVPVLWGGEGGVWIKFDIWWSEKIYFSEGGSTVTRRDLIHRIRCEVDAHVDEFYKSNEIADFENTGNHEHKAGKTETGYVSTFEGSRLFIVNEIPKFGDCAPAILAPPDHIGDAHIASIRQIAWELDESLKAIGL